jgi:phosphopantothenoylcysteine synthetase/decarboxylase
MERGLTALVIAGGTEEPIDDVRVITNRSTGRFGAAIANQLAETGIQVELLSSPRLQAQPQWLDSRVAVRPFSSFASLAQALDEAIDDLRPTLVFMAAAVADYSPVPHVGKLSSEKDALVIHLKRNPKLLASLRDKCGENCTIVGFKLLSQVSTERLIAVARAQANEHRLDLTVANDSSELSNNYHPIWMVSPAGDQQFAAGSKEQIAKALVAHTLSLREPTP